METGKLMELRKWRGMNIAKTSHIVRMAKNEWAVPSQSKTGAYTVKFLLDKKTCTCPDFIERGLVCKHIFAVEISQTLELVNNEGIKTTITKTVKYSQDWTAYNKSQIEEKEKFLGIINGLIEDIEEPQYVFGRPKMPLRDSLFASALKVYSQFSLRRFQTDLRLAKEKGFTDKIPCYSSVGKFMERADITPMLYGILLKSSLPLKAIETKFAIDSSGFSTKNFGEYCNIKHKMNKQHEWMKAHICIGVKTGIITSAKITEETGADSPQFIPMLEETKNNGFSIMEASGDKAYSSRDNVGYVDSIGGTAFIPFKSGSVGKPRGKSWAWRKMFHYFMMNREEFLEHYHLRSNVESIFGAIKNKFGGSLKSRTKTAQTNELLLKLICYNITILIQQMNELNINLDFL